MRVLTSPVARSPMSSNLTCRSPHGSFPVPSLITSGTVRDRAATSAQAAALGSTVLVGVGSGDAFPHPVRASAASARVASAGVVRMVFCLSFEPMSAGRFSVEDKFDTGEMLRCCRAGWFCCWLRSWALVRHGLSMFFRASSSSRPGVMPSASAILKSADAGVSRVPLR
nr:MAG TPA_asm: hypothetical protein [Caudoviricetes sp.]